MEPITLTLLGGAVLTEGVRFLYDQAGELIRTAKRRRAAKAAAAAAAARDETEPVAAPATVQVPVRPNTVLDGPVDSTVDADLLDREDRTLIRLAGAVAPYAAGHADISPDDPDLIDAVHKLRALIEAAYGQRLTLRGEQREPSGTRVDVNQVLGEVFGDAVGLRADSASGEVTVHVEQSAATVHKGGSVTGAHFGKLGGPTGTAGADNG